LDLRRVRPRQLLRREDDNGITQEPELFNRHVSGHTFPHPARSITNCSSASAKAISN
jgi:hypothetical protein